MVNQENKYHEYTSSTQKKDYCPADLDTFFIDVLKIVTGKWGK